MSYVTLIKSLTPDRLGKRYYTDDAGNLVKEAIAQVSQGKVTTLENTTPELLADLLGVMTKMNDFTLMPGHFIGEKHKAEANLISERKLSELMGCASNDVPGGVQQVAGERYVARLKRGIEPSDWILVDADSPAGIPKSWAAMSLQERLEMLDPIMVLSRLRSGPSTHLCDLSLKSQGAFAT